MSKKRFKQAFAIIGAGLFLVTSVSFSILVIWDQTKNNDKDKQAQQQEADLQNQAEQAVKEGSLKGTKLADFTPVSQVSELQVTDIVVGTGKEVAAGATITAHYTGASALTGIIFESSKDSGQPATFPLSNVIQGWQQGVPGMKEGGTRRLIIPSSLAYGEQGSPPTIAANEPLVFDIDLVSIQ